jgi:hypothetical protein
MSGNQYNSLHDLLSMLVALNIVDRQDFELMIDKAYDQVK